MTRRVTRRQTLGIGLEALAAAAVSLSGCKPTQGTRVRSGRRARRRIHLDSLVFASATDLALAIRHRQVSSLEVVDAFHEQIQRHHSRINAVVTLDAEGARSRARQADEALARGREWGPLHGVPFTVKDSIETAGVRTTSGFPPLSSYVPRENAPTVSWLLAAGGVMLGKTNLPPLAAAHQSDNPIFGRTNNPWDVTRTPGGSSGGGAAAVACGMTPIDLGSDLGGSLRRPAHCCGVLSMRPTEHRVPTAGHIPELPGQVRGLRHMATIGPIARSAADIELVMSLLCRPDGNSWDVPRIPLEAPVPRRSLSSLRLAWIGELGGVQVAEDVGQALLSFIRVLQQGGARLEQWDGRGFDATIAAETFGEIAGAELGLSAEVQAGLTRTFQAAADSPEPVGRGMFRGFNASMRDYAETLAKRDRFISTLETLLEHHDALLCPVTVTTAFEHCPHGTPQRVDQREVPYLTAMMSYTTPFSVTGSPCCTMWIGQSPQNLPIGLQILGRRWRDVELIATARALIDVVGPCPRPPGF